MKKQKIEYDQSNALNLKMVIGLNRATNQINRKASLIFKEHGLTPMQFAVLEALFHLGPLTIGEILEKILATGGNLTVVVKNLKKQDLITQNSKKEDQRVKVLEITKKGEEIIEEIFPPYLEDLNENMSPLTDKEKEQLTILLKKLSR